MRQTEISSPYSIAMATFAFLISLGATGPAFARANDNRRPRLFFTPEKVQRLQQRLERDERARAGWQRIKERADRQLGEDLVSKEYAEGGTGQHGNYGRPSNQMAGMGSALGLAYRMTGSEDYARKLREAMIHYGRFARWAGDAHHTPPWHSELNTARFCFGYAVAYDSIHDFLDEAERASLAQSMIRLGILPTLNDWVLGDRRIHALDSMGHNWWSVCVSMAGLAALSLAGDEPQAEAWVEEVSEAFPEWFCYQGNILQNKSPNFDRDGAFYESVGYADYALSEYLLFRLAAANALGPSALPDIPLLKTAGNFFLHTAYPTDEALLSVNFGDSSLHKSGARTLRLLLANGYDTEAYQWYLGRTDPGLDDPIGLIYDRTRSVAARPQSLPTSVLYPDIGWAVLRSSWDDNATMLAAKSGFTWNHAHPDAGSFILFHAGKPLLIDSGNCSYSRREYSSYYRQSKAHNVILIDGEAQNPEACSRGDRGVKTPGQLHHLLDAAGIKYVFADATGPTAWKFSRNYRHFLWIDDVILIFDDVRAHEPGRLEWLLHYEGDLRQDGSIVLLTNEDATLEMRPLFPEDMQMVEKMGLKDHDPDTTVPYLALTPEGDRREAKFVTALIPLPGNGEKGIPRITSLKSQNALGVRIENDETVTDVWLNLMADGRRMHRNSNNVIDGWDTDAYLVGLTRPADATDSDPDTLTRCFVACGSYLRKDGKVALQSLSKVYTVFTCRSPEMQVALQGQPIIRASIRTQAKPRAVSLNGKAVDPAYDAGKQILRIRLDGERSQATGP
ncbi:MAG: heparinase II/III family protein [Phycisphaerales bacterium]|nr:MAG: heparinase II/III family protein [Phycisphaerales bacterium]